MSYEGYTEWLCERGHHCGTDCMSDDPVECNHCGAPMKWRHGVDQTNGYDESHPSSCEAPKILLEIEEAWHTDMRGTLYALPRRRWAPRGTAWTPVKGVSSLT